MTKTYNITLIPGDGIGPEVTTAARRIIEATGVSINWDVCEAGAEVFKKGQATGVPQATIDSIMRNKVALKGPLETPIGFGEKSANVTLRKLFEAYGNIRPVREVPGIKTPFQGRNIDFVIVRENLEDLYAGIEHMQTPGVAQCLKIISRKGCEKIVRLAFEVARAEGRKTVHCATKANIMKLSEGLMKRTFEEIAKEYPDIQAEHIIVDNAAHQLVRRPEQFDVIVTTNMNGDILSDLGSGLIGGLGFAPGANIGDDYAIFEAVHGSAPKYAGKNTINPTAVVMSGVMMLRHLGEFEAANAIEQALFVTLDIDGIQTRDTFGNEGAASTSAFADAIIKNLGRKHSTCASRNYQRVKLPKVSKAPDLVKVTARQVNGLDVFLESSVDFNTVGKTLETAVEGTLVCLKMISSRGVKLYPGSNPAVDVIDMLTARFSVRETAYDLTDSDIADIMLRISKNNRWNHIEKLNMFDGKPGYTKAHGED
ncbi:MAG: NADP-dependent isocitrate dehydrogenase [Candidatus Paracaedibacteraceae bacterium]|nr:NADP-dependent isocitrate dehydrogenase [Candidatus Paracaedibacteraceae bacterium]